MSELPLTAYFGPGATQDATSITILKSSLFLTAEAENGGDRLFAGIMRRASMRATRAAFETNTDQSIFIEPGFDSVIFRTVADETKSFNQQQLVVNFAKEKADVEINPDDY